MKKSCLVFIILFFFILIVSCGNSKKANETPDSEGIINDEDPADTTEDELTDTEEEEEIKDDDYEEEEPASEKKRGTLGGECYPNKTCNIGLVCDTGNNICIKKEEDPKDDEPDEDLHESEHLEKTKRLKLGNICTNQDKCYNETEEIPCPEPGEDFYGQDAQYTDKCAKQKFQFRIVSNEQVVEDVNTGFQWRKVPMHKTYSWGGSRSHCNNISFADDDWNLPTPQELLTIIDNGKDHPALNNEYFPEMPDSDDAYLWTGNYCYFNFNLSWAAGIYDGQIMHFNNDETTHYFMCMKGTNPAPSFKTSVVNGEEIVHESVSGLIWQKNTDSINLTWKEALAYCENLEYAGFDDWRLPNKNELASLINYEAEAPASDFPDMEGIFYYWSSSSYVSDPTYAWAQYFYDGMVWRLDKTKDVFVRCVRNAK